MTKKTLKIAILTGRFPCISEAFILNQIIYLRDQGHSIDIYANDKDNGPIHPSIYAYNLISKTRYHTTPPTPWRRFKVGLRLILVSKKKLSLLKTLNVIKFGKSALSFQILFKCLPFVDAPEYDIIHAHYGTRGMDVIDIKKAGFLKGSPLITTFHGFDISPIDTLYNKRFYKPLFKSCSLITANSNYTINLLKRANCPENKLVKIPVSLDTTFFKRKPSQLGNNSTVNIAFCGRFIEFKAPDLVIEIAKQIIIDRAYTNVQFHLVGTGELQRELAIKIIEYGLSEKVFLHGSLVQDKIINLLSQMDLFLYPGVTDLKTGRAENQGLVLQEAQALELPVITSNAGGIPEGVLHDVTGFVLRERDVTEFVEKIEMLIADKELRRKMGSNARKFVVENFDNQILCKKLEMFYYSICKDFNNS